MPAMIRIKGFPQKIAFKILGKPDNLKDKKSAAQKKVDKRLLFENTQRVR